MSNQNGYSNPAYIHQYDASLYDYEYVAEIDPDSPQIERKTEQTRLVHPVIRGDFQEFSGSSEEFEGSDESNRSIIVEECNNRRVTLICEKRNRVRDNESLRYCEDGNCNGAYYQDVSLDSENGFEGSRSRRTAETVSLRHKRRLDPPDETRNEENFKQTRNNNNNNKKKLQNRVPNDYVDRRPLPPQRQHRYEEIDFDDYDANEKANYGRSRHRYAEISIDENGYPSLEKEFEVETRENRFASNSSGRYDYPQSISPDFDPRQTTYQRTVSPHPPEVEFRSLQFSPKRSAFVNSPARANSIEMSELSPPKTDENCSFVRRQRKQVERQPPVGASAPADVRDPIRKQSKNVIQKITSKISHGRQGSLPDSPDKKDSRFCQTPKSNPSRMPKSSTPRTKGPVSRRNILDSFPDPPPRSPSTRIQSPYVPTTVETDAKTAVVTPILQRKNHTETDPIRSRKPENDFEKISHLFQSTGNILQNPLDKKIAESVAYPNRAKIKRNQSVPNFAQTFANESRVTPKKFKEFSSPTPKSSVRNLNYQYSPTKSLDRFSPVDRSRLSLIDHSKTSWSNSGSDYRSPPTGCLTLAAVIQLVAGIVSCAVGFYLFSKVGRRYYLDFGILAGFVSLVLGALGFRSHCWRWLPNRNYVSGYIVLAAFSVLSAGGLVFLITAKPLSGDPVLDVMGGAICGVSVLTIIIAITGLTMSGCCKTPPPDNRVNNL